MQKPRVLLKYGAAFKLFSAVAILWFLFSRFENVTSISSSEIDSLLYEQLKSYEVTLQQDAALKGIMQTALTSPDDLTVENRARYIDHERRFFKGWEVAWKYRSGGYFANERFQVWDDWYLGEARRRPSYAWTENRENFASEFIRHVDEALGIRIAENASMQ